MSVNGAQILAVEFVLLVIMLYISVRCTLTKFRDLTIHMAHYAYSLVVCLIINIPIRMLEAGMVVNVNRFLYYVLYTMWIICVSAAIYFWFLFAERNHHSILTDSTTKIALWAIPVIILVVMGILNYWNGALFYIDSKGYHRGNLFLLQNIIPHIYIPVTLVNTILAYRKDREKGLLIKMLIAVATAFTGSMLQIFFGGSYSLVGLCLGSLFIYIELCLEEQMDKEKTEALRPISAALEERIHITDSMGKIYHSVYYLDLKKNTAKEIQTERDIREMVGDTGEMNLQESLLGVSTEMVLPEYREQIREFFNLDTIEERMKDHKVVTMISREFIRGWTRAYLIEGDRDEAGKLNHLILAIREVNEEKALEEEQKRKLSVALAAAEHASRAKTVFLSNMSHDIRTPMNAIVGFSKLAADHAEDEALVRDYMGKVGTASEHLLSLINDVLDMSRIESGNVTLNEKALSLKQLLEDLKVIIQPNIEKKNLRFALGTEAVDDRLVYADQLRLNQILLNILSNAVKFTPENGRILMTVVKDEVQTEGSVAYIFRIRDTGIGMSEELKEHIFESFTREKTSTVSGIQGSGLGMAITKSLVDMMKGTIEVESREGHGTQFTVGLSFRICQDSSVDAADHRVSQENNPNVKRDFTGRRLLVVEDNALNFEIANALLKKSGFEVEHAEDGSVAVEMMQKAKRGYYDLILMDIQMPIMDGYEATTKIRALPEPAQADIPIIAMTANAFEEDKERAFAVGMNGHVAKPIHLAELLTTIGTFLNE